MGRSLVILTTVHMSVLLLVLQNPQWDHLYALFQINSRFLPETDGSKLQQLPRFQQTQLSNYTMRVGKTVQFSCTVGNLGPLYKVIPWTSFAQMYFIVRTLSAHFSGCVAALGKGYVSCASICDHSERPRERLARQSGDVQSSNRRHPGRHSSAFTFRTSSSGGNHALQIEMETTLHRARFE